MRQNVFTTGLNMINSESRHTGLIISRHVKLFVSVGEQVGKFTISTTENYSYSLNTSYRSKQQSSCSLYQTNTKSFVSYPYQILKIDTDRIINLKWLQYDLHQQLARCTDTHHRTQSSQQSNSTKSLMCVIWPSIKPTTNLNFRTMRYYMHLSSSLILGELDTGVSSFLVNHVVSTVRCENHLSIGSCLLLRWVYQPASDIYIYSKMDHNRRSEM